MKTQFYTYLWLREDGTPYYVGKGKDNRGFESKSHRYACPPQNRIRVHYWPDEETAFAYEIFFIDFYGRKDLGTGCLRNLTDGGEGVSGLKCSPSTLLKMREAKLGKKRRPHTEETKRKMREKALGNNNPMFGKKYTMTEERREKISASHIGMRPSHSALEKLRTSHLGQLPNKGSFQKGLIPWNKKRVTVL
jgi:hypothetical protein